LIVVEFQPNPFKEQGMKQLKGNPSRRSALKAGFGLMAFRCLLGSTRFVEESAVQNVSELPDLMFIKWSHGSFLSVSKIDAAASMFTIANSSGVITSKFNFSLPDASRLWIHDFDLDSSGAVVFCGQCDSAGGQLAPFIAIKSPQAEGFEVIRTAPFVPSLLSVAPDGTFYVAGREFSNPNGHVIRHLTRTGSPIASMFPASQFQTVPQRMESGYLVATARRIGWYSPIDGEAVYVEMSPDLSSSSLAPGIAAGQGRVLGFALTVRRRISHLGV